MPKKPRPSRPRVIVTRRLPESVEQRMADLFDTVLNRTDTPMGRTMNGSPEAWAWVESLHALKRIASPDEQARSALYLASDASSFTTGTALLVDGGISINRT